MRPILALVLVASLAGCAADDGDEAVGPYDGDVTARLGNITGPPPAGKDATFSGVGTNATGNFTTEDNVVRVAFAREGSGPFELVVEDAGGVVADVASGDGPASGARYLSLAPGTYRLAFAGEGAWNATVEQDAASDAVAPPATSQGRGPGAPPALRLSEGSARFNLSHEGEGELRARLLDEHGNVVVILAALEGNETDEAVVRVRDAGVHYVDVDADGAWTLRVENA